MTVWATFLPFTACTHIECYNRKLKKQKTTKRNTITYIWRKCILKGKHSFWHIVLLDTHELTTDVIHQ